MKKNTAGQTISFQMVAKADLEPVVTGTPTVYYTGDGGTQATGSGTATHEGNGEWSYTPTQAETNYDHVSFTMVLTDAVNQTVNVYPVVDADYKADTSGLSTFDPATDTVANVTTTGSVTAAVTTDTASRDASKADVSGLSTFNPATDTVANVTTTGSVTAAVTTDTASRDASKADVSGLSTFNPATDPVATVTNVTNPVVTDAASRNASKADVSGLSTFDPATDTVARVTLVDTTTANTDMRGTDGALLQSNMPANWPTLIVGTGGDAGKVTTSNPALGGGSAHTAEDVRDLILAGDKTPIAVTTGSVNNVVLVDTTTDLTNGGGGGGDTKEDIYTYFTTSNREDVFHADVAGALATYDGPTKAEMDAAFTEIKGAGWTGDYHLQRIGSDVAMNGTAMASIIAEVQSVASDVWDELKASHSIAGSFGVYLDAPVSSSGGGDSKEDIYTYFTSGSNEDAFKADVSSIEAVTDKLDTGLQSDGLGGQQWTALALENTPNTSGGSGLYKVTVRVQDNSTNSLQGARVNVAGTTLTLTTPSDGTVEFNLDSGVYTFEVSPPAGYDTPVGQIVTVTTSDTNTTFTLTETNPGGGDCDIPWL